MAIETDRKKRTTYGQNMTIDTETENLKEKQNKASSNLFGTMKDQNKQSNFFFFFDFNISGCWLMDRG